MYKEENTEEETGTETTSPKESESRSQYEIERNKPMPNYAHSLLQAQIIFLLKTYYGDQFNFPSELSLDTSPGSTPDICIYPREKVNLKKLAAKKSEPPLTTIEIVPPSQSNNEIMKKAWDLYFPMGVKSAWVVIPEFKGILVVLPNDEKHYFDKGLLKDPTNNIELSIEKIFEDLV